jgi:tetratricopeptide (TPR) repeat protein
MVHSRSLALLLLPLVFVSLPRAAAQINTGNVHVYVTYSDDRPVTEQVKVALVGGSSGSQISDTFTNDRGEVTFMNVNAGNYHVVVSGAGIQSAESDSFLVDERKSTQSVLVRVRRQGDNGEAKAGKSGTISASDLKVPKKASQEFDKATKLMANQEWQKAIDQLNQALALYPGYAEAYTNLGVVYARLGDSEKEREALQKAIAANDHFAPAFSNLARMEMKEHNFAAAEGHLTQAVSADPTDVRTLVLLAQSQLLNHHYQDAIASAGKVHSMAHDTYALVHFVAARAWERLNRFPDAVSEFKIFLTEEPTGDRATAARQEMAAIEKQLQ